MTQWGRVGVRKVGRVLGTGSEKRAGRDVDVWIDVRKTPVLAFGDDSCGGVHN